jgi:hypothetical protein
MLSGWDYSFCVWVGFGCGVVIGVDCFLVFSPFREGMLLGGSGRL